MEYNRKVALAGVVFILGVLSLGILCRWLIAPPENPERHLIAVPFGLATGLLVCWYLAATWDPVNLRPRDQTKRTASGCWLPVVVIGGIVANGITSLFLPVAFTQQLAVCGIVALYMMFIYMAIQAWRYRPRN